MLRTDIASLTARLVLAFAILLGFAALLSGASAWAQSAEQIEAFRNLPPEQQRAVLEAMEAEGTGGRVQRDRELEFPPTVRPRRVDEELPLGGLQRGPAEIVEPVQFGPDDTLLIDLEIREFQEPLELPQPGAALPPDQLPAATPSGVSQPSQAPVAPIDRERIERTVEREQELRAFRDRVQRRNPYRLDKQGILNIPELGPVPLAGLTVEQATQRLQAETALQDFTVKVTRLPLQPIGIDALKPFGYDLFLGVPSTFAPATDVPVPAEYVVGPGDTIEVQLIGGVKARYSLVVGRDGRINFPDLGPIAVGGRRFDEVRVDLEARVREQMIGTRASVSIGELRSIRVFVLGDAQVPGSYTVSGLSTMTNALFVSGGVKPIGSLRNIQLKRNGQTVSTLDLYELLLKGDTSGDLRLQPGDVIFVPPIGKTASIMGEVRRPAIYELKGETSAQQLVALAGGLTAQADATRVTLERVGGDLRRVTLDLDLATAAGQQHLQAGDVMRVPTIRPILEDSVSLHGHVYRPGQFQFQEGMRLLDLIRNLDELRPNADLRYVLVRRELPPDRRVTVFSANLEQAFQDPSSAANFELAARDQIHIFDLESGRDRIISQLMRELELYSRFEEPTREVSVSGRIKVPGRYPLEPGMRVSDLLRAGGGLSEAAYGGKAELTRYQISDDETRKAELIEIDLQAALEGDARADLPLRPYDHLVIKEVPLWGAREEVEIRGEVRFPGRYPIKRGETLRSLLQRAGGVTEYAFVEGAVFTRRELRERERKQLETLATRMQSDLAQLSLQAAQETGKDAGQALAVGQSLLASLRATEAVGRLVIDLEKSMNAPRSSEHDVILKDGDSLVVPRITQEVTVIGEVQSATSHLFNAGLSRDDYIAMSGGVTPRGDLDHVYVVRANGSVEARASQSWFRSGAVEIKPGDTIVVPLDTERMRPLPFWTAVTTIIYNLAISAAAVNSF